MMLTSGKFGVKIPMEENTVSVFVVEDPRIFSDVIQELLIGYEGEESAFILSDNHEILKMSKEMEIVTDPFSIDFNNRKIQQRLYGEWTDLARDCDVDKAEINRRMIALLERIETRSSYGNIRYQLDFEWADLFKMYQVGFDAEFSDLEEKISEYIKVVSGLMRIKLVCFVNLKSFLSAEQLERVCQVAFYNKLGIILLENTDRNPLKTEKTYIIDKDMCLIIK